MSKIHIILVSIICIIAVLSVAVWGYLSWKFPYGWSHCCIHHMKMALRLYEEENGRYPSGEASPEASLSLLYKSGHINAYMLHGMTVPEELTVSILHGGGLLSPESCGWHYTEGLTRADNPRLALLWCKEPLGHNGNRTADEGRQVLFVCSDVEWISGDEWPAFLEEQKQLLKRRSPREKAGAPLVTGIIELPDGKRIDRVKGSFTLEESKQGSSSSSSSLHSTGMSLAELQWYRPPIEDGSLTRTIAFSNLISSPVTITFKKGMPDRTNVVYKMKSSQ